MIHTDTYSNNLGVVSEVIACTECDQSIEWNQGECSRQRFREKKAAFRRRHTLCKRKQYVEL